MKMKCVKKLSNKDKVFIILQFIIDKITSDQTFIDTKKNFYNERTPKNLEKFYKIYVEKFIDEFKNNKELIELEKKKLYLTFYLNETDDKLNPLLFLPALFGHKLSVEDQLNMIIDKINFVELNEDLSSDKNIYPLKIQILLKYMNEGKFNNWKKVKFDNCGDIRIKNTNSITFLVCWLGYSIEQGTITPPPALVFLFRTLTLILYEINYEIIPIIEPQLEITTQQLQEIQAKIIQIIEPQLKDFIESQLARISGEIEQEITSTAS